MEKPVSGEVQHGGDKLFSIVTAVYNVSRYLPEFIESVEKQKFDLSKVEVIAVDDGSTDDSLAVLEAWRERCPDLVTVLHKENGGQGSARNLGLTVATGVWVTYPDPDDILEPDYFARVAAFAEEHPEITMVATNRILFFEDTGELSERHPLGAMFRDADKVVRLDHFPSYFHGSAPAAFLRRDLLVQQGLQFDHRVQPNFEDGHFCVRYLLGTDPVVGFVSSARYIYRKRADQSSTLQTSLLKPTKYTHVPRYGYLDVLKQAEEKLGSVPEWLQNFIIYELSFYFTSEERQSGAQTAATGEVGAAFVETMREIRHYLDDWVIESFMVRALSRHVRELLAHFDQDWHMPYVMLDKYDARHKQVRLRYRYMGQPPTEEVLFRGQPQQPIHHKSRSMSYFGQVLMVERILWVAANGSLRVKLNGRPMRLRHGESALDPTSLRPVRIRRMAMGEPALGLPEPPERDLARLQASVANQAALTAAASPPVRRLFRRAWVLMDRIHDADDSGERLFRYLRDRRTDINAWFVLEKGTPDWKRLVQDGYGSRLVAHGSTKWKLLMLNCAHLISTHIDVPVHQPPEILELQRIPQWKFTFLQHGVIKDDLSNWLNPKTLDLFVTSTVGEHQSIIEEGGPYVFTDKEVKMVGLARFDRLLELGRSIPVSERNLVLVAPTWRHWLNAPLEVGSQRREVRADFMDTEYAQLWTRLLTSERLAEACRRHGLTIGFLPHPNIQPALAKMNLPAHVTPLTFAGEDVQRYFARAAVLLTDYSSMAFNTAYIDRPVVYYQFDEKAVMEGGHVGRAGYFDYRRDGFGPVTETHEATEDALSQIIESGCRLAPEYQARVDRTFTMRDGQCCARTVAAIEAL